MHHNNKNFLVIFLFRYVIILNSKLGEGGGGVKDDGSQYVWIKVHKKKRYEMQS